MKKLDFLIIGAAKAGTTSLYNNIKDHPEIAVPLAKEVPFFNHKQLYDKGLDWYLKQWFSSAPPDAKLGTVTPQYMYNRDASVEETAKRIKKALPNVKIVAMLRHPISRAFSHHKSALRRDNIADFATSVNNILEKDPKNIDELREGQWSSRELFIFGSEYYKNLEPFFKIFPRENILILFMDDFIADQKKVLKQFFEFIGVESSYTPDNLGKNYNKGGSKPLIPFLTPKYLHRFKLIRRIWRAVMPYKIRKFVEEKINHHNIKPDNAGLAKNSEVYQKLVDFYRNDVEALFKLLGRKSVWEEWD